MHSWYCASRHRVAPCSLVARGNDAASCYVHPNVAPVGCTCRPLLTCKSAGIDGKVRLQCRPQPKTDYTLSQPMGAAERRRTKTEPQRVHKRGACDLRLLRTTHASYVGSRRVPLQLTLPPSLPPSLPPCLPACLLPSLPPAGPAPVAFGPLCVRWRRSTGDESQRDGLARFRSPQ